MADNKSKRTLEDQSKEEKQELLKKAKNKMLAKRKVDTTEEKSNNIQKKLKEESNKTEDSNYPVTRKRSASQTFEENIRKKSKESNNEENFATMDDQDNLDNLAEAKKDDGIDMTTNTGLEREYFASNKFEDQEVCQPTKRAMKEVFHFDNMTHIQSRTIPHLLKGRDLLGAAKTGSGKTLAFLIPAIDALYKVKFSQHQGLGVLIITPTRELAQQIYDNCCDLQTFHSKTCGLIIGGGNRKQEAHKLSKGVNILVATPGRLLDHLQNTKDFVFHNLMSLIIDEADQILKVGFEEEMTQILKLIPSMRQTVLFSATQTKKVEELVRQSMRDPIYIGVDDEKTASTVAGLEQGFVVCPGEKRFKQLFTFLRKNKHKKVMVFFSSCNSVKFHSDLQNYVDVPVLEIHGKQKQQKRLNTFYEFCNVDKGILLCTDVAARGLDIPKVDWIVQFDPPDDVKEYIHRVGRTCRGANAKGKALLFLLPSELNYLKYLRAAKVELNEYDFPDSKLVNIQEQYDKLIEKNFFLNRMARDAYKSYLHAYSSHSLKDVFEVNELDLKSSAISFGMKNPPRVNLSVKVSGKTVRKNKVQNLNNNSKLFYKDSQKTKNDSRQFSR